MGPITSRWLAVSRTDSQLFRGLDLMQPTLSRLKELIIILDPPNGHLGYCKSWEFFSPMVQITSYNNVLPACRVPSLLMASGSLVSSYLEGTLDVKTIRVTSQLYEMHRE